MLLKCKKNLAKFVCLFSVVLGVSFSHLAYSQKQSGSISNINSQIKINPKQSIISKSKTNSQAIPKAVVKKTNSNVSKNLNANGNVRFLLRPKFEVIIASQMTGIINDIQFDIGERFKKGDTLIKLDCGVQSARVQMQRAKVRESSLNYKSNKELLAGNAVSRYEVDVAKSQLDQENALLREANIVANFCQIKAPFDGGVATVLSHRYELVSSNTPLLKIIDDSELLMSLNVPSNLISKVKKGSNFSVEVDETGKTYKAEVIGVSPAIDAVSKTIELRAVLVNKTNELKPGMSGKAILDFKD